MRVTTWILWLGLVCLATALAGQVQKLMSDPLFGISYDPRTVKFEKLPTRVRKRCPQVHNGEAWVYAHLESERSEYFIVSGLTRSCTKGGGSCDTVLDLTGMIVALRGARCTVEAADAFYWRKNAPVWDLPEAELNNLAWDALQRYAKAFGGKRSFLKNVKHREHMEPVLRKQLETFESQPET
jgi:hypothetical protein